jgi:segregation and condensation protein A
MEDQGYQVELEVFEGPLDLLLHLVKKHELNILDIPISFVTDKYLTYLDQMQSLDIDVAGEYLLMAATLCHIKSRELLPPEPMTDAEVAEAAAEDNELSEEETDPRADLIRRLLDYQKYKNAAGQLGERPVVGRNVWSSGVSIEDAISEEVNVDAIAPLAQFPVHKLIEAFERLMGSAKVKFTHNVTIDRLSVSQKISELTDRLELEGKITFSSMFSFLRRGPDGEQIEVSVQDVRHEAVVTFLALLEMAKLRLISLTQPEDDLEIYITRSSDDIRSQMERGLAGTEDYR